MSQIYVALVIGMSNYGSPVVEECILQFRSSLPSTEDRSKEDEHEEMMQVFALTFRKGIFSHVKTLSTEFGSPYLLAYIVEKFLNCRKIIPKIRDIFLIIWRRKVIFNMWKQVCLIFMRELSHY